MKTWFSKSIIIVLFIMFTIFGFILGVSTQNAIASSNINNVQNTQNVNYKYEVVNIYGTRYIIFSNMSGSDIEVIQK